MENEWVVSETMFKIKNTFSMCEVLVFVNGAWNFHKKPVLDNAVSNIHIKQNVGEVFF